MKNVYDKEVTYTGTEKVMVPQDRAVEKTFTLPGLVSVPRREWDKVAVEIDDWMRGNMPSGLYARIRDLCRKRDAQG